MNFDIVFIFGIGRSGRRHPDNFRICSFKDFILSPQLCMNGICDFIGVGRAECGELSDHSTLGKYHNLSSDEQREVDSLIAQHLPEFRS